MRSLIAAMALSVLFLTACTGSNLGDVPQPAGSQPPVPNEGPSAHPGTIALRWHKGLLPGVRLPGVHIDWTARPATLGRTQVGAVFESPTRLAFVSPGSGACISLPTSLYFLGPHAIRMTMAQHVPIHKNCVDTYTVTTVEVAIDPAHVDVSQSLDIQLADADGKIYATFVAPGLAPAA